MWLYSSTATHWEHGYHIDIIDQLAACLMRHPPTFEDQSAFESKPLATEVFCNSEWLDAIISIRIHTQQAAADVTQVVRGL